MTSYEYDFRDDANPYREPESMRSGDPSPECNSATKRAAPGKVPPLPSDWQVRDEPYRKRIWRLCFPCLIAWGTAALLSLAALIGVALFLSS